MAAKPKKYTHDYAPDKQIPNKVFAYIGMVVRRNPQMWTFLLVTDVLHGLRYPVAFYFVGRIIDLLLTDGASAAAIDQVWNYCWIMFAVLFVGEMCHLLPHYKTFAWVRHARPELRSDLLAYSLDHSYAYYQDHFAGSLARKISEGIEKVPQINFQIRWEIMLPIVNMVTSSVVLLGVAWEFALLVFAFILAITLPVFFKLKRIREKSQEFADIRSKVSGQVVDTVTNIAAVKAFANEEREMDAHREVSEEEMKSWHKLLRLFLMLDNYRRMTLVGFGGGVMAACIYGWQHELITAGEIATIMGIAFSFTALAWNMSFGIIHLSESLGYLNDSLHTLIRPHHVTDADDAKPLEVSEGRISFEQLHFEYGAHKVFEDLNLDIKPGQRVGLIGASGAGKTTLVNLLQRFFDVSEGAICIDGQNIAEVTQHSLRRAISVIPQDTSLFHRTLRENISYGKLDASDEEIIEAAKQANAHEFIAKLPDGYDTMVGERGIKLSGGQRQRIAIARAILKDAPILLLDEATSALDSESEKLIQESLHKLMKDRTVIAIAHRLSTINHLDRLVVMSEGEIVEDGTHKALLKQNGAYARLWNMQSGGFLPE